MLDSAIKKIVNRFRHHRPTEKVFVAAFGKHPGWDDHIEDIGLETDELITAKRILYVQGIGGNIDSGNWTKLQENQQIEDFNHVFVWCIGQNIIVGRLWSSRDGKGRTSYPMVVCVQCCQLSLEWIFENILPGLEKIEKTCLTTTSAADIRLTIENARNKFRQSTQQCSPCTDLFTIYPDALTKIADCFDLGGNREGLLRILYHIEREVERYIHDTADSRKAKPVNIRPTLLRVPASPAPMLKDVLWWISFLRMKLGANMPILLLMPQKNTWIDIIIGEPAVAQLYCLRAPIEGVPLTSSVPYNMDSEFVKRANQLIDDSGGGSNSQVSDGLGSE
ncbi:MAG: hypothetical protein ACYTFK_10900 [Planctomycetota bacterium]|jgi:hypothetical protein